MMSHLCADRRTEKMRQHGCDGSVQTSYLRAQLLLSEAIADTEGKLKKTFIELTAIFEPENSLLLSC